MRAGESRRETSLRSSFPRLASRVEPSFTAIETCRVPLARPFEVSGVTLRPVDRGDGLALEGSRGGEVLFSTRAVRSLSLESGKLSGEEGEELLFALERHPSPLDGENGVRPYVYAVGKNGLVARWRGSGLAWPLVDARLLSGGRFLCALHRGDSFLVPGPGRREAPRGDLPLERVRLLLRRRRRGGRGLRGALGARALKPARPRRQGQVFVLRFACRPFASIQTVLV